jgi:hypothetical protein
LWAKGAYGDNGETWYCPSLHRGLDGNLKSAKAVLGTFFNPNDLQRMIIFCGLDFELIFSRFLPAIEN